ncbi:MAG: tetratricopeptide repeat protein [Polyangiaceae bacterium]|nr:tetratricopeptide repeat protein [Polyangiaceae bacterium]
MRRPALPPSLLVALLALACSPRPDNVPPGSDPERMSQAEMEVARDLWLRQSQPREGLKHALRAADLDDANAEAAHLVALMYLDFCQRNADECRLSEAEKYARAALNARNDFREARNTLGVILIHEKRAREAVPVLKQLADDMLYTTPENAWGNLGWAYLELGQTSAAIDALSRAVAAQPMFCVGNFRLGVAHERQKHFSEALAAFTRALETDHPSCQALQEAEAGRARTLIALSRPAEARESLERCLRLSAKTPVGQECGSILAKLK